MYVDLEGQGDLASRLITRITHIVTRTIPIINLFTKSPDTQGKDNEFRKCLDFSRLSGL